jgi:hypothetical protein
LPCTEGTALGGVARVSWQALVKRSVATRKRVMFSAKTIGWIAAVVNASARVRMAAKRLAEFDVGSM